MIWPSRSICSPFPSVPSLCITQFLSSSTDIAVSLAAGILPDVHHRLVLHPSLDCPLFLSNQFSSKRPATSTTFPLSIGFKIMRLNKSQYIHRRGVFGLGLVRSVCYGFARWETTFRHIWHGHEGSIKATDQRGLIGIGGIYDGVGLQDAYTHMVWMYMESWNKGGRR